MASNYDSIDLDFTWDGDFLIDSTGDLKDTSDDYLQSIRNEIQTIVKSQIGDWREDLSVGADLDDFIGEANTRDTAQDIETRLRSALATVVNVSDLSIRVAPVHIYRVLIILNLEVLPTRDNNITSGTTLTITFLYDYFENGIYMDPDDANRFGGRAF